MNSCLYVGHIRHRRFRPVQNVFRYRIYLNFIDLGELPALFDGRWLWSARRAALAWFRRADYHGDPDRPLDEAVRDTVERHTGSRPAGPIRLLTHLRHWGWRSNPVSFYYLFNAADTQVETIMAEVTNTPWDERHAYVLPLSEASKLGAQVWRWQFDKAFHVSPFLPMDMRCDWRFSMPADTLLVHLENWRAGAADFDATLTLHRTVMTGRNLSWALAMQPLITVKVSVLIYWQALKLLIKRVPFYTHPAKLAARTGGGSGTSR